MYDGDMERYVVSLVLSYRKVKNTGTLGLHYSVQKTYFKHSPQPDKTGVLRSLSKQGRASIKSCSSIPSFYKHIRFQLLWTKALEAGLWDFGLGRASKRLGINYIKPTQSSREVTSLGI